MPNCGVALDSTFCKSTVACLTKSMLSNGGILKFPGAFQELPTYESNAITNNKFYNTILIDTSPFNIRFRPDDQNTEIVCEG